jgi:hypothetical protein
MCKQTNSSFGRLTRKVLGNAYARLAQSVEHQTFNLRVAGSSPSSGASLYARQLHVIEAHESNAEGANVEVSNQASDLLME